MAVYAHLFETISLNSLALRVFGTLFYSPVRHCRTASTRQKAVAVRENRCVILCHQYMTQDASRSRQREKVSFAVPEVTGAMPICAQAVGVAPGRCPPLILRAHARCRVRIVRICSELRGESAAAPARRVPWAQTPRRRQNGIASRPSSGQRSGCRTSSSPTAMAVWPAAGWSR